MTDITRQQDQQSEESPEQQASRELERQRQVIDLMTSAHSVLRDSYRRRTMIMTCALLSASVLATAFAFAAGDTKVTILGFTAERSSWLGWFAVWTFLATLVDLVFDWRGSMRRHEDAARQLAGLKAQYRTPVLSGTEIAERDRLAERYQAVMDAIPSIPERRFLQLKSAHVRKVELSRILSESPGLTVREARRRLHERAKPLRYRTPH